MTNLKNLNCDKTQIGTKFKLWQNSNCHKTQTLKLSQNLNYDESQFVKKKTLKGYFSKNILTTWQPMKCSLGTDICDSCIVLCLKAKKGIFVLINPLVECMGVQQVLIIRCTGRKQKSILVDKKGYRTLLTRWTVIVTFSWDSVLYGLVPTFQSSGPLRPHRTYSSVSHPMCPVLSSPFAPTLNNTSVSHSMCQLLPSPVSSMQCVRALQIPWPHWLEGLRDHHCASLVLSTL